LPAPPPLIAAFTPPLFRRFQLYATPRRRHYDAISRQLATRHVSFTPLRAAFERAPAITAVRALRLRMRHFAVVLI